MSDWPPGSGIPADQIKQLCTSPAGTTLALTHSGRIYERLRDPRHFNDGRPGSEKWLWREIEGPLASAMEAPS